MQRTGDQQSDSHTSPGQSGRKTGAVSDGKRVDRERPGRGPHCPSGGEWWGESTTPPRIVVHELEPERATILYDHRGWPLSPHPKPKIGF